MISTATQRCTHHPPRQAFALCMACRKPLCQECATQWDGIWHCASCLGKKRRAAKPQSRAIGWISAALMTLLLLFLSARVLVWAGALIAGLT